MNDNLDLDSLRQAWKKQTYAREYSVAEIFEMLKRKSLTSVKWIFMIGLSEILLGIFIYAYLLITGGGLRGYDEELRQVWGDLAWIAELLTVVSMGVGIFFIVRFYLAYKGLKADDTVKELSERIIRFRRNVNLFIYFNITIFSGTINVSIFVNGT